MKKIVLTIFIACTMVFISCTDNNNKLNIDNEVVENTESIESVENIESIDEHNEKKTYDEVKDMYSKLCTYKPKLEYSIKNKNYYWFKTDLGLVSRNEIDEISNGDYEKYSPILESYSIYTNEDNPEITYDMAMNHIKMVLPDDIIKEKEIYIDHTGATFIFYSSSKGNFVACVFKKISFDEKGEMIIDDDCIGGLIYMKSITE